MHPMQRVTCLTFGLLGTAILLGCTEEPAAAPIDAATPDTPRPADERDVSPAAPTAANAEAMTPVPVESGTVAVTPENTQISFVGTKPDGTRHEGGFRDFSGRIGVDPQTNAVESVSITIQAESLWSDADRLTTHLKSPDFFNVNEHPTITFESDSVQAAGAQSGVTLIMGDLTMLGETKEVGIPVRTSVTDQGLTLQGGFTIDRREFGMTYGEGQVDPEVKIQVNVGTPSGSGQPQAGAGRPAGPGGGGPGGGRQFDPQEFFNRRDADKDGKLTGDEIPERMRDNLTETDKDGDGAISLEEMQERMRQFRGRGPGGGPGGREPRS